MPLKRLNTSGDTIIEVLIVLAVLGMAISISYATASRSLVNTKQAQQNSQATKILQSQIEGIRVLGANGPLGSGPPTSNPYTHGTSFCIKGGAAPALADGGTADCIDSGYRVQIYYCHGSGNPVCAGPELQTSGTFLITAVWDNIRGAGTDSINFVYRYHGKWD